MCVRRIVHSALLICAVNGWTSFSVYAAEADEPFAIQQINPNNPSSGPDPRILDNIGKKLTALNLPPHSAETPVDTAIRIRKAIKSEDFATAQRIVIDTLAATKMRPWRFYPFGAVMNSFSDVQDGHFEQQLNRWVAQSDKDVVPLLLRSKFLLDAGWSKRGTKLAQAVSAEHMKGFRDYMARALDDVNLAIDLDPSIPYGFYLRLQILQSGGLTKTMELAFKEAIKAHPDYFSLYTIMLLALEPKWGGSVREMVHFVNEHAASVTDTSPLKMLYLVLYDNLLDTAQINCDDDADRTNEKKYNEALDCYDRFMSTVTTPELDRQVQLALELFNHYDRQEFEVIAEQTIYSMLTRYGAAKFANTMLQRAATAMKSDLQLPSPRPQGANFENDYIIDVLMATSWRASVSLDNAVTMLDQAASDIQATNFSSEGDRLQRLADIYDDLADYYQLKRDLMNAIVYESAALSLTGTTSNAAIVCFGLFQLRQYAETIKRCTEILDNGEDVTARFWRGMAHRNSNELDAAFEDLAVVADSNLVLRVNAAMEMSTIRYRQGNIQGAVDVLNKYPYLFDPAVARRSQVADNYNNRCFVYKQLGELQMALDNCTESLKYGNIPDAYKDQQELLRLLGKH